jgi:large subunit ribosomal protein L9
MKIILIENVPSLGKAGDVVQVAAGYGRNFLIPKKLALEMDSLLPSGEKLVFFRNLRDSALFYTDRRAIVLHSEQELLDYLVKVQLSPLLSDTKIPLNVWAYTRDPITVRS